MLRVRCNARESCRYYGCPHREIHEARSGCSRAICKAAGIVSECVPEVKDKVASYRDLYATPINQMVMVGVN